MATDPYVECRVFGHSWEQIPSTARPMFGVYIWTRCTRCATVRKDIVQPHTGDLLSRSYDKPKDYKRPKTSFADLRVELVKKKRRTR